MKNTNRINSKSKTLGLLLAALVPTGAALADGGYYNGHRDRGINASGTVVVTKEIPGGVITVGATIGNPRPVVVERRKVVVVKQEERCEPQKVVVVRKAPVVEKKVVVVEKHRHHHHGVKRIVKVERNRHDHGRRHDRDGHRHDGHDHGRQVSIDKQGPNGSYHYYEDDRMVSIDDNRNGQNRHVYVKK